MSLFRVEELRVYTGLSPDMMFPVDAESGYDNDGAHDGAHDDMLDVFRYTLGMMNCKYRAGWRVRFRLWLWALLYKVKRWYGRILRENNIHDNYTAGMDL